MTPEMRNAHLASLVIGPATGPAAEMASAMATGAAAAVQPPAVPVRPGASAAAPPAATVPPAPAVAPPAPAPAAPAAHADAPADPAAAERARISAIVNAPEADNRAGLARHLAFATGMSAAEAVAILAAAPQESAPPAAPAPAPRASLDDRMANTPTPPVGISAPPAANADPDAVGAAFILAAARRARGEDK